MNTIIYSLIVIFILSFIFWLFYPYSLYDNMSENNIKSNDLILTATKTGSIAGLLYKLEIYKNGTYKLYNHGELQKTGTIDGKTNNSIKYLINKFPELEDEYCKFDGTDGLYYGLKIGNQEISLGVPDRSEKCLPDDINDNFRQLDKLMT